MGNPATQPVSELRVLECIDSAEFWSTEIGPYAEDMRKRADFYAISSVVLSTITGLGVWSTLAGSTHWPAVLLVSLVALASAAVAAIPQIKGYGRCAEAAASLGPRYGHVLGELEDALAMLRNGHPDGSARASQALKEFEEVRTAKQNLRPFPVGPQEKLNDLRAKGTKRRGP
jgi:hypothetical protein